jgi:hypothetical protein
MSRELLQGNVLTSWKIASSKFTRSSHIHNQRPIAKIGWQSLADGPKLEPTIPNPQNQSAEKRKRNPRIHNILLNTSKRQSENPTPN